ncbi:S-ribosylhomocysteine lyase [Alkalibaculum sp. M08DMB]|uniref:S-ribosylhomocysteine lyase n=1 Tax=Alkalibaculum sporogenes TaxID=2655001 RepID=A0A6A7KCL1_9FIRM|nr:S-ribosylhomocysteine lyase [Alkalibaculum sporogenes]MPW26907.1 S-ribosylhomocysteine lyase [Alkalibaculum sporogenes]
MNTITSFTIDHNKLLKGLYVSRRDSIKDCTTLTTFDIRMKQPNIEPVLNTAEMHTIEHVGATFLRNHEKYKDQIIYFGPMGCRTGFYLIIAEDINSDTMLPLITELFEFIANYDELIPGASAVECGNFQDMNLNMAKYESKLYLEVLYNATVANLEYPN